jgi:hypothetical protein
VFAKGVQRSESQTRGQLGRSAKGREKQKLTPPPIGLKIASRGENEKKLLFLINFLFDTMILGGD